jgi:hypothetical protein
VLLLFYKFMPETKPTAPAGSKPGGMVATFSGYALVLKNMPFMAFMFASILMMMVYQQMYNTLSVFLVTHGVDAVRIFIDCSTVVVLSNSGSKQISLPPFLIMALGGFFTSSVRYVWFCGCVFAAVTALVIITIGEMIVMPTSRVLALLLKICEAVTWQPSASRGPYRQPSVQGRPDTSWTTLIPTCSGTLAD